jgi:uncharacterized membrane-anchored protein
MVAVVGPAHPGRTAPVLVSKVPEVTLWFWLIKIMATTVGETAADLLSIRLGLGLGVTSLIMTMVFLVALILQVRATHYVPAFYWVTVVAISVVGTLVSDNLVDGYGVSLVTTSIAFAVVLALVFVAWWRNEGTLSIHSIVTRRRELYYWAAILFTFALGTSVGDLLAETMDLGYGPAAVVFGGMIAAVALAWSFLRLDAILAFWVAYVLTRPLGASLGALFAKPVIAGGFGLGTVTTSLIFLGLILGLVVFLTLSRVDRLDAAPAPR